ncbi:MAG: protein translocase subunit SecF, partial [Zetaproteobacteria bacterium]|nr:protein translocase subunit SecF [Zetaproteobacteria bacterium]
LVLLTLFFLGGATTQHFALVLAIGVLAGTYSSIFLAAPLLVALNRGK